MVLIKSSGRRDLFNEKNCDITLLSQDIQKTWKPVVTIPVKFPITNFKQNANNYFENMIGETVNLQSNNISVHHFIILPELLPYLNRQGEIARMERITNHDIDKYRKLMNELESANTAKPKDIFLGLLSFRGVNTALFNNNNIRLTDMIHQMTPTMFFPTKEELLLKGFSQENSEFLVKHSNLSAFIKKIALQFNGLQSQKTGSDKKNDILYKQNN